MTPLAVRILALIGLGPVLFQAQSGSPPALTGFPFTDEDLNYSLNWPSGINLGEAHLHAKRAGAKWDFRFTLEGGIPGFAVRDVYGGQSTPDFCSISFDRSTVHGSRKADERETIDSSRGIAARVSSGGGGHSDVPASSCIKDALTFLFYTREELGQGRVPPAQDILFGGLYRMSLAYSGAPMISLGGKQVQSDEVTGTVKGPASSYTFDMYFARDPARSPLLVKAPFAMGMFSMELMR